MKFEFSRENFVKFSKIKFHENSSIGSQNVRSGQTDGQKDMTNTIVVFRNSGSVPETCYDYELVGCDTSYFRR